MSGHHAPYELPWLSPDFIFILFSDLSWVANGRLTGIFPCRFGKAAAILAAHVKAALTAGYPLGRFVVRSVSAQCVLGHTVFIYLAVYSVCLLNVRTHAFTSFQPLSARCCAQPVPVCGFDD